MRRLRTIRISVTGRCDLDCVYCSAREERGAPPELSADDVMLLAEAAALAGARTVRLTGGEPLLREDIEDIVGRVSGTEGIADLALTTNAQRLLMRARELAREGLDRVNVGLPSLRPETYRRMTGGELARALAGLEAALGAGLSPVKLNVVVMRGANDGEIGEFVELARTEPVEVRFIEAMPFASADSLVPAAAIRGAVESHLGARLGPPADLSPTAGVFQPAGLSGRIGVIAPVTEPFCDRCDRLRVTSDGRLRACLSEPGETDLRPALEAGADPTALARIFLEAFGRKPRRHRGSFEGGMRRIGG